MRHVGTSGLIVVASFALIFACGPGNTTADAGVETDSGEPAHVDDAGDQDAGAVDAGTEDGGSSDGGSTQDGGGADAGFDAGFDAGPPWWISDGGVWRDPDAGAWIPALACDPNEWCPELPKVSALNFEAAHASAPNDLWVVARDTPFHATTLETSVLHFDGTNWKRVHGLPRGGRDVWSSGPNDAWVVGDSFVVHWDGTTWSHTAVPDSVVWTNVHGTTSTDVWVVGNPPNAVLHWNGARWNAVPAPPAPSGTFVERVLTDGLRTWVGHGYGQGRSYRWEGGLWTEELAGVGYRFAAGGGAVWSAGISGINRWLDGGWVPQNFPTGQMGDIAAADDGALWVLSGGTEPRDLGRADDAGYAFVANGPWLNVLAGTSTESLRGFGECGQAFAFMADGGWSSASGFEHSRTAGLVLKLASHADGGVIAAGPYELIFRDAQGAWRTDETIDGGINVINSTSDGRYLVGLASGEILVGEPRSWVHAATLPGGPLQLIANASGGWATAASTPTVELFSFSFDGGFAASTECPGGLFMSADHTAWNAGCGEVRYLDGGTWTPLFDGGFTGITGSSDGALFIRGNSVLYRWFGGSWLALGAPTGPLAVLSATEVWVGVPNFSIFGGEFRHWDGQSWTTERISRNYGQYDAPYTLVASSDAVYAAGYCGLLRRAR